MSISAYSQQPTDVQLKVVNVSKEQPLSNGTGVASSKVFTISFSYQKKAYRTKVMKAIYAGKETMYKIVMPGNLNNGTTVHWLQRQDDNWAILLGEDLDEKLLKAVTSAIECME